MALTFGAVNTDAVTCTGSISALNQINAGTALVWCYPTSVGNVFNYVFAHLLATPTRGFDFFKRGADGTQWQFTRYRSVGTHVLIRCSTGTMTANAWQCLAITWDTATVGNCKFYRGTLSAAMTDVTDAGTVTIGAGTPSDDSTAAFSMGNDAIGGTFAFPGVISTVMIVGRVLSASEIAAWRVSPRIVANTAAYYELGLTGSSTTEADWSGSGGTGTRSGATVSAHVPLIAPFRWLHSEGDEYAVAAATGQPFHRRFGGMRHSLNRSRFIQAGW